jgi:hypothetical protein
MTVPRSLLPALRRLLRPLIRLLIARGVTYPMLTDLLKRLYVQVALRDFGLGDAAPTDSRVTLLTGVHRKDVHRLRAGPQGDAGLMPESVALGTQLVAAWITRPEFTDARRNPRPLPRLASQGGGRSFEALVASVSKDIRPRSVLDEWRRLGIVTLDDKDRVVLRTSAFVPSKDFDAMAFYLGHNVHDHIAAAAHNLLGEGVPYLERSVHYDALDPKSVQALAALAKTAGMKALQALNRKAMASEARDRNSRAQKRRFTFGIYFFEAPAKEGESRPAEKKP